MNCNVSMVLMMMIPIRIDAEFDDFEVRYAIYKFLVLCFFCKILLKVTTN